MNREEERKKTLDHHIDERFGEIFFLAKDEFEIASNTAEEQKLWDLLENYKITLKQRCEKHFG